MSERLNDGFDDLFTMPIVSEDDTLSDPLNKEKEKKKKENTFNDGFDDLFSDSFDKPLDIPEPLSGPEPSFARKFDYGLEQEQTILGNLAQSFVAGAKSLTRSGLTFEESLRESERQRQEDIFKEYPEFKNRPEDAAVMTGRITQALADPLPWVIPWTKIAQAGRAATITTGAGFAVGDVALREKVLYGEVDPSSVLMAGVFGGAATYGADVIARKFMKPDTALDAEFVDASGTVKTLPSKIKDEPDYVATPEEQDVLREVGRERLASKSKTQEIFDSGPDSYQVVKSASLKISSYEELDSPLKITKRIEELKKLGVNVSRTQLEREAALRKIEADKARKTLSSQTKKLVQTATDYAKEQLDDLEKTGTRITLSDGLIRKFVYEGTRPLFGGVSGAIAGSYLGEDDDDMLMYTFMGIGAGLGAWQGQVQRSKFLTKPQKQIIKDTLDQEARLATNTWLKINTAGTHAARLNAWGGASSLFSKLMYKQMGASLTTAGAMPVEQRSIANVGKLFNIIHEDVLRNVPREMLEDVGKFRNGFTTLDDLAKKYTPEELTLIQQASQNIKDFTDELGGAVSEVGIDFKLLENYGLTQMWDWDKISKNAETFGYRLKEAWAVQTYKLDPTDTDAIRKAIEEGGDVFENQVTDVMSGLAGTRATTAFDESGNVVIPLLKNFEKERVITDQNARVMLQDYIINDPSKTLGHLVSQTIPSYEFAKTFGAKGELLKTIRKEIHQKYNPTRQGTKTTELEQKEIQHIKDSVNAYFGLYGNRLSNETGHIMMAGLTMLGNSTMLTRVSIPSLGDLIQPLQNSGFMPIIKTYAAKAKASKLFGGKQDTFSSEGLGIKYQNVLESELQAIGFGVDPSNRAGRWISNFNSNFFKIVQLKRITDFARGAAYDAGVFRAYDIAKRVGKGKKISDSLQNELNALGLKTDELLKISKFKNAREAYDNVETKQFLHKAGFNSSERDAIIPTVGNRLLFAQSNNPFVRSLGQFLSWAQAKTTQTNALVSRIEDGDAALALRMLAALSIYGGVREMQIAFSPSEYYKEEANVPERWSTKYALEAMKLSGNFVPFQVEKVLGLVAGPGASEGLGGAIPSLGLTNDLIKAAVSVPTNVYQGDLEGAASDVLDVTPFGRDFKNLLSGDFPIQPIEIYDIKDEPKSSSKRKRRQYAEGTVDVPFTKDEPEERINSLTGRPYTDAYKRRTAFGAGGIASILRGIWKAPTQDFTSAATSIPQTPAGFKKIKALDGWQTGTKNLDIGGGASFKGGHKHTDALREEGVENLVFDPFNRTPEENALAVERLGFGKADTVTAHNVLNVIPDETSQLQVIKQMENALKPGGKGYITVYKGAGTGKGKQSRSDSFQQNKKTDEYLPLIRKVFPNAERKGDLIYFSSPAKITSQFHGTTQKLPAKLQDVDLGYTGSEQNIYGSGFYTTSKQNVAKGYAKQSGYLYEVIERKNVKLFNMDDKVPEDIKKEILESPDYFEFESSLAGFLDENPTASLLELHDAARDIAYELRLPSYEVQDYFFGWAYNLMEKGYNGYRHIGGVLSKGEKHEVKIYWNPSESLDIKPIT